MTRYIPCAFLSAVCLFLLSGCDDTSTLNCDGCKAKPPKPEALVGTWIGFDSFEGQFCRLDLRTDSKGYFAHVPTADYYSHDYGVEAYRVTDWTLDRWRVNIKLTPATTNAEPIYLRGYFGSSLTLEFGSTNGCKRGLILYRESLLNGANQEIMEKINVLDKR